MTTSKTTAETLAQTIRRELDQNVFLCYQCVKCSSGCPLVEHMDLMPNQVMRAVQLDDDGVLESKTIWLCASCQTCTTRCPQALDIAGIMCALRIEARKRGVTPAIPEVDKFNTIFLREIEFLGRLYEVGLMGGMNLWTRQPFKDMGIGLGMLRRGKLKLLPDIIRSPREVKPVKLTSGKVAYYPGCSLHSSAAEYDRTVRAAAEVLDLELVEPPGWICCGSSSAHSTNRILATVLPIRTLATVEQMGLDSMTTPCSGCFARMKAAAHTVTNNDHIAQEVEAEVGYAYQGQVEVEHLLDTLVDRSGLDRIETSVKRPLTGLNVACYYGCLITRPPKITRIEHVEHPMKMDHLVEALGAEPVNWSYKTDCCGGTLGLNQPALALEMTQRILENARDCGADVIATACPLCHVNLDARQRQIGLDFQMPVLYITQLMVLAFGLGEKRAALSKNFVDPRPMLNGQLSPSIKEGEK